MLRRAVSILQEGLPPGWGAGAAYGVRTAGRRRLDAIVELLAARVVRALGDFGPPVPVTTVIKRAGASTGATHRVLDVLEQEALVTRGVRRHSAGPLAPAARAGE